MKNLIYSLFFINFILFNSDVSFNNQNNSAINLKEDLVIKSDNIGQVGGIQIDSKGQIYISDDINKCIHIYSPTGKFLRKIGKKGKAPGEYQFIWGIQITKGDSLIVYDGVQYRITLYAPGKYDSPIKTITIPVTGNELDHPGTIGNSYSGLSGLWISLNNNKIYLIAYSTMFSKENLAQKHFVKIYKINNRGELIQKEPLIKIPDSERFIFTSGESSFSVGGMPFGKNPIVRLSKDGLIYYGETDKFNITVIDLNGKKQREINYKTEPIFITDKLWENELKNYSNLKRTDLKKSKVKPPEYLPLYDDFTIDDNDNLWVAVNEKDYRSYKYHVFDKQGKLINTIKIPDKTVIKDIKKGYAYGIRTNDWGIQSLVRYKVESK